MCRCVGRDLGEQFSRAILFNIYHAETIGMVSTTLPMHIGHFEEMQVR